MGAHHVTDREIEPGTTAVRINEPAPLRVFLQLDDGVTRGHGAGLLRRIRARWHWILTTAVGLGIVGFLCSLLLARQYDAEVTVIHVRSDAAASAISSLLGQTGALGAIAGLGLMPGDQIKSEDMATLRSRAFTKAFIEQRRLLPILFAQDWDEAGSRWRVRDPEDVPDLNDAYELFDEEVRHIREDRKTGVLTLTVRWDDPELAVDWANDMVRRANSYIRSRAISDAKRNIEYLNNQLKVTDSMEVRESLYRLLENETKSAMLATVREEYAFKVIDPAQARARDDYDYPNHLLIAVLSACLGGIIGFLLAIRTSSPS